MSHESLTFSLLADVGLWHKTDLIGATYDVCLWEQSGLDA
jgi:hypothetical protein